MACIDDNRWPTTLAMWQREIVGLAIVRLCLFLLLDSLREGRLRVTLNDSTRNCIFLEGLRSDLDLLTRNPTDSSRFNVCCSWAFKR